MTLNAAKMAASTARRTKLAIWMPALLAVIGICIVFGLVFQHEIARAVRVWSESTAYNHCFLVLPLIAMLLWKRRDVIARLRPTPSWWALALVPALSVAWGFAALADIFEIEQLVIVGVFETLLIAVLGWHVFRALM